MTREEAAEVLELLYGDCDPIEENTWQALRMGVAALRGPQPDPKTGLMPCRWCGGKAGFHYSVMMRDNHCYVECGVCGEHSEVALSEDKARDAWNYSMGYRGI